MASIIPTGSYSTTLSLKMIPSVAFQSWSDILKTVVGILVIIVTITGNTLVILSYRQDRNIRNIPGNRFILSLSVADLMVGCVSIPVYLQLLILKRWVLGDTLCKLYMAFDYFVVTVGVMSLINISLDRYWIVIKKLRYRSFQTTRRSRMMIAVSWLVPLVVIPTLLLSWPSIFGEVDHALETCDTSQMVDGSLGVIIVTILVILPSFCILYLNITLFIRICLQHRRFRGNSKSSSHSQINVITAASADRNGTRIATETGGVEIDKTNNTKMEGYSSRDYNQDNSIYQGFTESHYDFDEEHDKRKSGTDEFINTVPSISGALEQPRGENYQCDIKERDTTPTKDILKESVLMNIPAIRSDGRVVSVSMYPHERHEPLDLDPKELGQRKKSSVRFRIHENRQVSRIQHAALMLSTLVIVFVICWMPFAVVKMYDCFSERGSVPPLVTTLTGDLVWLNSTVNPIIYAVTNPRFRKNFIRLIHSRSCCQSH
ncbi:muscarinic acetylcholine receptor M3-like [Lytechinus variegatus]|uniref:muscarinic acetylcholine receptor M3-like n=1 Tax=Lytechinus variegatus TaxID=7654 RepID=UPI001BB10F0D|nr:muscarinic acetylcholine receptor M3-like [Lytechinus variegatus]